MLHLLGMNSDMIVSLSTQAIHLMLWLSMPTLVAALVIGVAIALVQAVTQIQEMTLTFVPKIFGVFVVAALTLPWMLEQLISFTVQVFNMIPELVH